MHHRGYSRYAHTSARRLPPHAMPFTTWVPQSKAQFQKHTWSTCRSYLHALVNWNPLSCTMSNIYSSNAIEDSLGSLGCNIYCILVVDLLHKFELGVFKSVFKCYDRFFSYASFPQSASPRLTFPLTSPHRSSLLPEGGIHRFVLLSPQTSISTNRFSCTDYVVPLTHRFYHLLSRSMMTRPSD